MVLNTTIEDDPSTTELESMEASSSMDIDSYTKKRKAETDPTEEEEESDDAIEECRDYEPEPKIDMLKPPEWDVDSFDGLEYWSSGDEPSSDDDEVAIRDNPIYKRQIIESKGFYVDPELRPSRRFKRIVPLSLELQARTDKTYGQYWEEIVHICLERYNQDKDPKVEFVEVVRGNWSGAPRSKSYITFMAREKPDGPLIEYQAKGLLIFDGIRHPILCRPASMPKPEPEHEIEEESDIEIEECRDYEPEPKIDMLKPPEWDVDSFDGLEYWSSGNDPSSDEDEVAIRDNPIYKRQIIESKGFYVDPELRPSRRFKRIRPLGLELEACTGKTFRQYWEEIAHICLEKYNQDKDPKVEFVEVVRGNYRGAPRSKSYITFMAREKPDGPLVEYQAKGLLTFNGIRHPVLCRPAPTPKL